MTSEKSDIIVIGAGLAGLTAAYEAALRGRSVLVLDQEGPQNLGGQAFWSLGGLMMVDTPEQRRLGIKDSFELALADWMGSAQFDRNEDGWPRRWAEKFVEYAAGGFRSDMAALGLKLFPVVGWAERGGAYANGHGNSVPRFHISWGTGTGVVEIYVKAVQEMQKQGKIRFEFRRRVNNLIKEAGAVVGVSGEVLAETDVERGQQSNRDVTGDFEARAESVIVSSGGIGGNHEKVRANWPTVRLGRAPRYMISGVPHHVDGLMQDHAIDAGANAINQDRMWHYVEGVHNWDPIWPKHAIRILPGPSSIWFDALGCRMQAPCMPGFDTLGTLKRILSTGYDYSWLVLTQKIIEKEFALSGSEQNQDLTSKSWLNVLRSRLGKGATPEVEAFKEKGQDFLVDTDFTSLVKRMNALSGDNLLDEAALRHQIELRDSQINNKFGKDAQVMALYATRNYIGDRLMRTAKPHKILDPEQGPLIAVKLNILTRKSLGGLETNLESQVMGADGQPIAGLYAAGEVAGFGGGGYHGYNSLEGTFLGGCIFSGQAAGRNA